MNQELIGRVGSRQKKIDQIVSEIPVLYERLSILLTSDALNEMLYRDPVLPYFQSILTGDLGLLSPPAASSAITTGKLAAPLNVLLLSVNRFNSFCRTVLHCLDTLCQKNSQLSALKGAVLEFLVRVQRTLKWPVVVDLCMGSSSRSLFAERRDSINLLDIYCDHMLEVGEAERWEQMEMERLSGTASPIEDSCDPDFYW